MLTNVEKNRSNASNSPASFSLLLMDDVAVEAVSAGSAPGLFRQKFMILENQKKEHMNLFSSGENREPYSCSDVL